MTPNQKGCLGVVILLVLMGVIALAAVCGNILVGIIGWVLLILFLLASAPPGSGW